MREELENRTIGRARWTIAVVVLAAILLVGGGWWLASSFQSPAQQEANAKPPSAAPVMATVGRGMLAKQVSFTGQVGPSLQTPVAFQAASGVSVSVVTGRPVAGGSAVSSGSVLTEVNGRPVFAAQSPFAFYRDMGFGDHGPDVTQLQTVLASLGYSANVDGQFGAQTVAAVNGWYQDNGYSAPLRPRVSTAPGASTDTSAAASGGGATDAGKDTGKSGTAASTGQQDAFVPLAEIVAVPSQSSQVLQGASIGTHVASSGKADLILGSSDVIVSVSTTAAELGDVVKGDTAKIAFAGAEVEGIVGDISKSDSASAPSNPSDSSAGSSDQTGRGQQAGAGGQDQSSKLTFIVAPKTPLPAAQGSGTARVTVTKNIVTKEALLVPVLAVSDRGGDTKVVTKRRADGTSVEVPVSVLGTLQGQVAVEPVTADALKQGDEVRVG